MNERYTSIPELTTTEKVLAGLCEGINENPLPKRMQRAFHNSFGRHWIRFATSNLLEVNGMEHVETLAPERGVILCSNHRSFFDMYIVTTVLRNRELPWFRDVYFPVRSNFFYDDWRGLAVNLAMSGGAMYPPIFRDKNRSSLNKLAVERICSLLERPGSVIGMHPEGTRGKGEDPYEMLPAKPGVGQMALRSKATVVPIWLSGMRNDLGKQVASNFQSGSKKGRPVRVTFGSPVDLSSMEGRNSSDREVQLEAANLIMDRIRELGHEERERIQKTLS